MPPPLPYSGPMPGNMWDSATPAEPDLDLRLLRVGAMPLDAEGSALHVKLETTRGEIDGVLHPVEGGTAAVICAGGAMGGVDGPADALYARLPILLRPANVTVLRIDYRKPDELEECVLDILAGCSFMKGIGATDIVLIGHSFGGAVVIKAGELHEAVRAVVSMSPQLHGTREVEHLGKPLLLIHGMSDSILNHEASEDIYRRALEPKRIVLYAEAGHSLIQAKDQIDRLLADWVPARFAGIPMEGGREEHQFSD